MLKFSSCFTFVLLSSSAALAASCEKQPSCEELGYSKSEVANCKEYLSCLWDASYKKCLAISDDTCSTGQLSVTCGTEIGYSKTKVATSSNGNDCYECKCSAPEECKWTDSNKGTASVSSKCCNGSYKTCASTCNKVTVPTNAHGTDKCTACGESVYTAWACNDGYTRTSAGTGCIDSYIFLVTVYREACAFEVSATFNALNASAPVRNGQIDLDVTYLTTSNKSKTQSVTLTLSNKTYRYEPTVSTDCPKLLTEINVKSFIPEIINGIPVKWTTEILG